MATKTFRGDAVAVSDLWTIVLGGTVAIGNTVTITIGAKSYTYTAATAVVATEAAALVTALQALSTTTYPEFSGLTWAYVSAGTLTATGTAGIPFGISVSKAQAGGATNLHTFAATNTTPATGPNFLDTPANWGGSIPASGDTIIFENWTQGIYYGLSGLAAVAPAAVYVRDTFTAPIGLPRMNGTGMTAYIEYRQRYAQFDGATLFQAGNAGAAAVSGFNAAGIGSGRLMFDFGASAANIYIYSTGSPIETGVAAMQIKGSSLAINVTRGSVGIATFAGETATLTAFKQSGELSDVEIGSGVTIGGITVLKTDGKLTINCAMATGTLQHRGGETIFAGTGALSSIDASEGGDVRYRSSGTLTGGTIGSGAHLDCTQDLRARTFTNLTVRKGAKFSDPAKTVTFSNPIVFQCQPFKDCTIDWGPSISLQRS